MELMVQVQNFQHFSNGTAGISNLSPYPSAPSSPARCGNPFDMYNHYTSAPASPRRAAAIYKHFNDEKLVYESQSSSQSSATSKSSIPFNWEVYPGTPKNHAALGTESDNSNEAFDFSFDHSGQLDKNGAPVALTSADELFEKGKIRPLKLPPRLQHQTGGNNSSSNMNSPRTPRPKGLLSPHHQRRGSSAAISTAVVDPFVAAMLETTKERGRDSLPYYHHSRSRKGSRSLSPPPRSILQTTANVVEPNTALKNGGGSKKWRLKDLLLFRSASEGRATGNRSKDPIRKYMLLSNKKIGDDQEIRSSSFRSLESYSSSSLPSVEPRRKTALAYRQGIFSWLGFNPAINSIARGFGRKP